MGAWVGTHVVAVAAMLSAACSFDGSGVLAGDGSAGGIDASAIDAGNYGDAPDTCMSWNARHFVACSIPAPDNALKLTPGDYVYDTTNGSLQDGAGMEISHTHIEYDQGGTLARLVSVSELVIDSGAALRVVGTMPLIVASWSDITINGTIDAGSYLGAQAGAGSNPAVCNGTAASVGEDNGSGTGGGAGGALQGAGGYGGDGDIDHPPFPSGGLGGTAVSTPTIVRGGCWGSNSGNNTDLGSGHVAGFGVGGAGGGAIQLTALSSISVSGTIVSGGAGGGGGPLQTAAGGGGGGSGGYIGFDSSIVRFGDATIVANGGGGGEGPAFASSGENGEDGRADGAPATGGFTGASCAGDGANGSAGGLLDGRNVATPFDICGGGGGGGGAGYILRWTADAQETGTNRISPAILSL